MKRLLLVLLLFLPLVLPAQEDWLRHWEAWAEENEEETLPEELVEMLSSFHDNPFNINDTSSDRLLTLPVVSQFQWECLKAYIAQQGQLQSVAELSFVNGFDSITLRLLRPLCVALPVSAPHRPSLRQLLTQGKHNLVVGTRRQIEPSRGYTDSIYEGDPFRLYFRYNYQYGNLLQVQFSGDKDPGEAFRWDASHKGFDHYSGYIALRDWGRLKNLTLGRYNLQFGQGLTLWSGFAPWTGMDASQLRRGTGVRGAGAMAEYGYLQGAAATIGLTRRMSLTAFGSYNGLDATVSSEDSLAVQSIYNSGYHRTSLERSKRNQLQESLVGASLRYEKVGLSIGATGYTSHYSRPILPASNRYNYFYFNGTDKSAIGVDAAFRVSQIVFFGEMTACHNPVSDSLPGLPLAGIVGAQFHFDAHSCLSLSYRYYGSAYHNMHNAPLSQSSSAPSEQGTRLALHTLLPGQVDLYVLADCFSHPLPRYGVYAPSWGGDLRVRLQRSWRNKASLSLQYRYKESASNASLSLMDSAACHPLALWQYPVYVIEECLRQQLQIRFDYPLGPRWMLSSRLACTQSACEFHTRQLGWLVQQGITYEPTSRWQLSGRYTYFSTDGYDSRLYAMESDLLYEYSSPALQGRGHRAYLILRWKPYRRLALSCKYGLTAYTDRTAVGSGYDITQGPYRQEVKLHLRLAL